MKRIAWTIVAGLFIACNNTPTPSVSKQKEIKDSSVATAAMDSLRIEIGRIAIEETGIDGCSGLFKKVGSMDSLSYHFATDLQGNGFIRVDGKVIKLSRTKSNNSDGFIDEEYTGGEYRVLLVAKESSRLGDELSQYIGELTIEADAKSKRISIAGEVGC